MRTKHSRADEEAHSEYVELQTTSWSDHVLRVTTTSTGRAEPLRKLAGISKQFVQSVWFGCMEGARLGALFSSSWLTSRTVHCRSWLSDI